MALGALGATSLPATEDRCLAGDLGEAVAVAELEEVVAPVAGLVVVPTGVVVGLVEVTDMMVPGEGPVRVMGVGVLLGSVVV